jgi:hypothetical protein
MLPTGRASATPDGEPERFVSRVPVPIRPLAQSREAVAQVDGLARTAIADARQSVLRLLARRRGKSAAAKWPYL